MTAQTTITQLLDAVTAINRRHAAAAHEERRDFNVFTILRQEDDEVNLHSRFLFELLNPAGGHGMGARFLALFLEQLGIAGFDVASASVLREHRNIDLFIANDARQAVIVENKIHAPDQPRQLQRYHRAITREGFRDVRVVYLTLHGDPPSAESLGRLAEDGVTTASYRDDVCAWIAACAELAAPHPVIRETLVQYQRLVEALTGQTLGQRLMDIKALLTDEETLAAAIGISQALVETKIDVQFAFWRSLEERLAAAGFEITEYWKYSRKKTEAYYRQGPGRYGLLLSLPELAGEEIVALFVGVSHRVYYGFAPLERGSPVSVKRQPGFAVLAEILHSLDAAWSPSESLIGWRPTRRKFDFQAFGTPDTLALMDAEKRDAYLDELVDEIAAAIEAFYAACEDDPRLATEPAW